MKRRLVSFAIVLTIIFSGAFSCLASAASRSPAEFFYDLYWEFISTPGNMIEDVWNLLNDTRDQGREKLRQKLFDQEHFENPTGGSSDIKIICADKSEVHFDASLEFLKGKFPAIANGYKYLTRISRRPVDFTQSTANNGTVGATVVLLAVPTQYADNVSSGATSNGFYINYGSTSIPVTVCTLTYTMSPNYTTVYTPRSYTSTGSGIATYQHSFEGNYELNILIQSDFGDDLLRFEDLFDITDDTLSTVLVASRQIVPELDGGPYTAQCGIYYDDGNDNRSYAGNYVHTIYLDGAVTWAWSFDLAQFRQMVYRKRCGLTGYNVFLTVYKDGDIVFSDHQELALKAPGGIFEDTEDPPNWDDYKPEPEDYPTYNDVDFEFQANNYTWNNYTWNTINNYNSSSGGGGGGSSGEGGGGSGSGGGDDSSSGSDPSGGEDPSGGDDPQDFDEWTSDAFSTLNDNIANLLEVINNNLEIMTSNFTGFAQALEDYLNNSLNAALDYIAELIKKFNRDFNNWTDALGDYIGDHFDVLNHNIAVIGDNIVKAIKTQVIPDKDVVFDMASAKFPFVSDFKDMFSGYEPSSKDIVVSIPSFISSGSSTTRAKSVYKNSSRDSSSGSVNSAGDGAYTYNISEIMRDNGLPQFRTVGSLFILGSTLWSLINISFKIFGLHFSSYCDD